MKKQGRIYSCRAALFPGREKSQEFLQSHRFRNKIALRDVTSHGGQQLQRLRRLYPFGYNAAVERVGELDGGIHHQAVMLALVEPLHEATVELDFSRWDLAEVLQRREASAIIVDGDLHA